MVEITNTLASGKIVWPPLSVRDVLAVMALPGIYQHHTMITDRAADLAYEQADELLRARNNASRAVGKE